MNPLLSTCPTHTRDEAPSAEFQVFPLCPQFLLLEVPHLKPIFCFLCFCVKACQDYEALRVAALLLPGKKQQEPKLKAVF